VQFGETRDNPTAQEQAILKFERTKIEVPMTQRPDDSRKEGKREIILTRSRLDRRSRHRKKELTEGTLVEKFKM